jgi:hypothetical protein
MEIITAAELASYLRDDSLATDTSLVQIVGWTNDLVTEEWTAATTPVPVKIKLLALNVAARGWAYNPATANLESLSRTLDDASRTERYRTSSESGSIYLTEGEEATLNGRKRRRSIRLTIYGDGS